jgi:hypothetical protein
MPKSIISGQVMYIPLAEWEINIPFQCRPALASSRPPPSRRLVGEVAFKIVFQSRMGLS